MWSHHTSGQQLSLDIPTPNAAQLAWQEADMGVVFHYDLHVFDRKRYAQNGLAGNRTNPVQDYQIFNPEKLDTDQWIKAVSDTGFKFHFLRQPMKPDILDLTGSSSAQRC